MTAEVERAHPDLPERPPTPWPWWIAVRAFAARHPIAADLALAVAVFLLFGGQLQIPGETPPMLAAFAVPRIVPLAFRRRWPRAVFAVVLVAVAAHMVTYFGLTGDGVVLIALYTVAARYPLRWAVAAAVAAEIGAAIVVLRWPQTHVYWEGYMVLLTFPVVVAFGLGLIVRARRALLASLEDRARRAEHERDQQTQIAAGVERARIAREIHDIVAHNLSVMIALADGVEFAVRTGSPRAESAARHVSDTGRRALAEMHRVLGVLRDAGPGSSRAPLPGVDQLDNLVAQVRAAGLPTSLRIIGEPFTLPTTAGLAVYRIVQEALTNVLKHAESPSEARVRLTYRDPVVDIDIVDDGRQPDRSLAGAPDGHGLTGMRERAAMFGGTVTAGPAPAGWRVSARLDTGRASTPLSADTPPTVAGATT